MKIVTPHAHLAGVMCFQEEIRNKEGYVGIWLVQLHNWLLTRSVILIRSGRRNSLTILPGQGPMLRRPDPIFHPQGLMYLPQGPTHPLQGQADRGPSVPREQNFQRNDPPRPLLSRRRLTTSCIPIFEAIAPSQSSEEKILQITSQIRTTDTHHELPKFPSLANVLVRRTYLPPRKYTISTPDLSDSNRSLSIRV